MKSAKQYTRLGDVSAKFAPRKRTRPDPIVAILDDSQNRIDLSGPLNDRRTPEEHELAVREAMEAAAIAAGPFIKFKVAEYIEDQAGFAERIAVQHEGRLVLNALLA